MIANDVTRDTVDTLKNLSIFRIASIFGVNTYMYFNLCLMKSKIFVPFMKSENDRKY
jgi:hypothetical protein